MRSKEFLVVAMSQPLHFSEQYLTFSQSLAHFLRHSNPLPQRKQTFGSKPFLVFGVGLMAQA
jgi:hypothetical protein